MRLAYVNGRGDHTPVLGGVGVYVNPHIEVFLLKNGTDNPPQVQVGTHSTIKVYRIVFDDTQEEWSHNLGWTGRVKLRTLNSLRSYTECLPNWEKE